MSFNGMLDSERKMEVLMVFNTAGVPSTLATFLPNFGIDAKVVTRKALNKFGFPAETLNLGPKMFVARVWTKSLNKDLIHVNAGLNTHNALKRFLPKKKFVMHFLGSDIRLLGHGIDEFDVGGSAILYSAPDISYWLPDDAIYLPIPIDRRMFSHSDVVPDNGSALSFSYGANDEAKSIATKQGLKLEILDRTIPFVDMPKVLRRYEFYIDTRKVNGKTIEMRSTTALQALSVGVKVIEWNGSTTTIFPKEHDASLVAEELSKIYSQL